MPANNKFQHQTYPSRPAVVPIFRKLSLSMEESTPLWRLHRDLQISRIILVHGTFMGDDSFGVVQNLTAPIPSGFRGNAAVDQAAALMKAAIRRCTTHITGDIGNFTEDFRQQFERLVEGDPMIELPDPTWSGQNDHLARADLAIRLFHRLLVLRIDAERRALLWGHSHAGNGFALLTNLLANDRQAVEQFFDAAGEQSEPHWQQIRSHLKNSPSPHPLSRALHIVTFGTPIRYGWDTEGCCTLHHILHHREPDPDQPFRTNPLFPPQPIHDVLAARYGDWIQAFGIAGTDVSTPLSAKASHRLGDFLQSSLPIPEDAPDLRRIHPESIRRLCARWKTGTRCHSDGRNILVDYESSGRSVLGLPVEHSLLGHGVATSQTWLPAHLRLVCNELLS